jgi:hypothetical protein
MWSLATLAMAIAIGDVIGSRTARKNIAEALLSE